MKIVKTSIKVSVDCNVLGASILSHRVPKIKFDDIK